MLSSLRNETVEEANQIVLLTSVRQMAYIIGV